MPTFNGVSEQTEATHAPTQLRQQQHNDNHVNNIAWMKIT